MFPVNFVTYVPGCTFATLRLVLPAHTPREADRSLFSENAVATVRPQVERFQRQRLFFLRATDCAVLPRPY
jgi:hypothetical protein